MWKSRIAAGVVASAELEEMRMNQPARRLSIILSDIAYPSNRVFPGVFLENSRV